MASKRASILFNELFLVMLASSIACKYFSFKTYKMHKGVRCERGRPQIWYQVEQANIEIVLYIVEDYCESEILQLYWIL
jgi:hypothetical protein